MSDLEDRLGEAIGRQGPIPFSRFMHHALYDPTDGFFATAGRPGRAGGDFITSPEVGPLFGALVARALDGRWRDLGCPDPMLLVDAGAGTGRLVREVLRAEPACAPALRAVLVESSPALRRAQRDLLGVEPAEDALGPFTPTLDGSEPEPVEHVGPIVTALDDLPAIHADGVVIANELLDNLPFDVVERTEAGWDEVRVGAGADGGLEEVKVAAGPELVAWLEGLDDVHDPRAVPPGARIPVARAVDDWLARAASVLRHGVVMLLDYAAPAAELAARDGGWLRTYRAHGRGAAPLDAPGTQDITSDLVLEAWRRSVTRAGLRLVSETTQAAWLHALGIDALVADGRARWEASAAAPDLAALEGRSRATEAAALTDLSGLGAHTVVVATTG